MWHMLFWHGLIAREFSGDFLQFGSFAAHLKQ
jgi:hypothetical protein